MNWISFFSELPKHGQKIWYYGEYIGVWRGHYIYEPNDPVSPHLVFPIDTFGLADRMDCPWWMPYEDGMQKPDKPSQARPENYPK